MKHTSNGKISPHTNSVRRTPLHFKMITYLSGMYATDKKYKHQVDYYTAILSAWHLAPRDERAPN